jgi:hypothetical protein
MFRYSRDDSEAATADQAWSEVVRHSMVLKAATGYADGHRSVHSKHGAPKVDCEASAEVGIGAAVAAGAGSTGAGSTGTGEVSVESVVLHVVAGEFHRKAS